jgi:hypothetical protein
MKFLVAFSITVGAWFLTGCSVGVKEKSRVIYVSIKKPWPEGINFVRISDSRKIKITYGKDVQTKMKLQGFYIISEADFEFLIKNFIDK